MVSWSKWNLAIVRKKSNKITWLFSVLLEGCLVNTVYYYHVFRCFIFRINLFYSFKHFSHDIYRTEASFIECRTKLKAICVRMLMTHEAWVLNEIRWKKINCRFVSEYWKIFKTNAFGKHWNILNSWIHSLIWYFHKRDVQSK